MTNFCRTFMWLFCIVVIQTMGIAPLFASNPIIDNGRPTNNMVSEIGDFVFSDNNGNGMQDVGEQGIAGIFILLTNQDDNTIKFAITDNTGNFSFTNLTPGNYTLKFPSFVRDYIGTLPDQGNDDALDSDFNPTTGLTPVFILGENETNLDIDAGYIPQFDPCVVDADNDGICAEDDCDDNNPFVGGMQTVGTSCDDGDATTINDEIQADGCSCAGTPDIGGCVDADNDGVCAEDDCDDMDAAVGASQVAGTSCDDGDATTINDEIQADGCSCVGTPDIGGCVDADNDGVCAEDDCDDMDAAIGAQQVVGTSCDDGDATTINDEIQADGCSCVGTPDTGGNPTCETVSVATENGSIAIAGLTAPILAVKIYDKNAGWAIIFDCFNDCNGPTQMIATNAGEYNVHVQFYDANYGFICEKRFDLTVSGTCMDADNDGICVLDDCNDEDAAVGGKQVEGTPCDDGDMATINDQIQMDGCTCAGIPDTGGEPDCNGVRAVTNDGNITISNLTAPIVLLKVFDKNAGWSVIYECFNDCTLPEQIIDAPPGAYNIHVQFYDPNWNFLCEKRLDVIVNNGASSRSKPNLELDFYPNPAQEVLYLHFGDYAGRKGSIEVINQYGAIMDRVNLGQLSKDKYQLDLINYTNGFYLLSIQIDDLRVVRKKFLIHRLY